MFHGGISALEDFSGASINPGCTAEVWSISGATIAFYSFYDSGATANIHDPPLRIVPQDLRSGGVGITGTSTWRISTVSDESFWVDGSGGLTVYRSGGTWYVSGAGVTSWITSGVTTDHLAGTSVYAGTFNMNWDGIPGTKTTGYVLHYADSGGTPFWAADDGSGGAAGYTSGDVAYFAEVLAGAARIGDSSNSGFYLNGSNGFFFQTSGGVTYFQDQGAGASIYVTGINISTNLDVDLSGASVSVDTPTDNSESTNKVYVDDRITSYTAMTSGSTRVWSKAKAVGSRWLEDSNGVTTFVFSPDNVTWFQDSSGTSIWVVDSDGTAWWTDENGITIYEVDTSGGSIYATTLNTSDSAAIDLSGASASVNTPTDNSHAANKVYIDNKEIEDILSGTSDKVIFFDTTNAAVALDPSSAREALDAGKAIGCDFGTAARSGDTCARVSPFTGLVSGASLVVLTGNAGVTVEFYNGGKGIPSRDGTDGVVEVGGSGASVYHAAGVAGVTYVYAGDIIVGEVTTLSTSGACNFAAQFFLKEM